MHMLEYCDSTWWRSVVFVSVPRSACRRQHGSRSDCMYCMHMYIKSDLHHSCAALHQAGSSAMCADAQDKSAMIDRSLELSMQIFKVINTPIESSEEISI